MSDITPKPLTAAQAGVAPVTSITAAAAPPTTASAAEIPAAVANLSVGTLVTGTVLERGPRGLTVLRTDKGTIKLYTPVPLKPGSTVTLQIQSLGAQVQLSILSVDGHPLAQPIVKAPATPPRPGAAIKPPVEDGTPPQPSPSSSHAGTAPSAGNTASMENSQPTAHAAERLASDRGASATQRPAAGSSPSGFVARPLIASISATSLEILSPTPAPVPGTGAVAKVTATPGATTASGTTLQGAQGTSPQGTQGTTPPSAPSAASLGAPSATVHGVSGGTAEVPQTIALGARFVATFASPPPTASPESTKGNLASAPHVGSSPSPSPTAAALPLATATASAATAATPVSPDRVILRLLGMESPGQGSPAAPPARSPAATPIGGPQVAAGLKVADNAITTVGTIIADGERPKPSAGASAAPAARTLIATSFGTLEVAGAPPGPAGTKLLLEIVLGNGALLSLREQPEGSTWLAASDPGRTHDMPVLRSVMDALQNLVAPGGAAEHVTNTAILVPRPGPQLAAELLFFAAVLRQGSPRAWLGEHTVDALKRAGHGALIDKLGDEFAGIARLASETSPNGWQTMLFPVFDGERLQQIRLHVRRQRRKDARRDDGTRFMVEAELSKFGPVQLDGLFSKPQFDLVVRTRTALPPEIRGDIIDIFGDALLATQLKGAVSFQAIPDIRPGPPADDGESGIGFLV